MAYEMTIRLTDQEYNALVAEATKKGKEPETLLHDMVQHLEQNSWEKRSLTGREFMEKMYEEGELLNLPTREPLSQEERTERERLAQVFSGGKSGSEMVIEDRGPY